MRWYTWTQDKIELRGEWTSLSWPLIADEELLRHRDNHDLEILRLADGSLVETQPLRDRFNLQPGAPLSLFAVESPIAAPPSAATIHEAHLTYRPPCTPKSAAVRRRARTS